jgi:hypothetical protein
MPNHLKREQRPQEFLKKFYKNRLIEVWPLGEQVIVLELHNSNGGMLVCLLFYSVERHTTQLIQTLLERLQRKLGGNDALKRHRFKENDALKNKIEHTTNPYYTVPKCHMALFAEYQGQSWKS